MALSTETLDVLYVRNGLVKFHQPADSLQCEYDHCIHDFARAIEAEARRDALEEAAQAVEKATYRKRWAKAAVNSQASNVPPCELAAAIRKLKEDIQ